MITPAVTGKFQLMPIGDDRNIVTDTNGSITDVIGVGPVLQQVPNVVQSTAQNVASWAAAPGEVFAGQQPQTPGMWSDVDEAIAQANLAGQYQWGPQTAMTMMGAGGAPADAIAMGRPSIEYLNARRAAKPASGGKTYARAAKQAPDVETMTPEELTAAKAESDWASLDIAQEAYWDNLFKQFGLTRGYGLDETFGSGSRKLAPVGAVAFTSKLPKHAEEVFSEGGATVHKLQKSGRYPSYVATSPEGEAYQFKDFKKAKHWAERSPVQRPEPPADPNEIPPWFAALVAGGAYGADKAQAGDNFEAARKELKLTPQEEFLYQRHLHVLSQGGVPNPKEGGTSTLFQTSAEHNGRFYNIPTLWDGQFLDEDQAAERAGAVGWDKWPSYPTREKAEQRYQKMHDYMEKDLRGK